MNIKVRNTGLYKEVIFEDGNAKIDLGLLDRSECVSLAKKLIEAAAEIIENA